MSLPRYSSYQAVNVPWMSELPDHWQLHQTKRHFRRLKEVNTGMVCEDRLALTMNGVIPRSLDDLDGLQSSDYEGYQIFEAGDLAFKLIDLQNIKTSRVGLVPSRGIMSPAYIRLKPHHEVDARFGYWYFMALYWTQVFNALGGGVRQTLGPEELLTVEFPVPSIAEKTAITAFLDHETAKIDALIAEQEKLIVLLAEKRQATISHAVTRGLNPDVPIKDSGVAWLGEVPANWEVMTFQRCVYVQEGQVNPEEEPYCSMVLIAPNHIESGTGRLIDTETAKEQAAESGKYLCKKGDVIYSKIRPALRKVCLAPEDCLCSADMYPMRGSSKLSNAFLMWFMLSEPFSALTVLESERVAMPKINRESLKAVWLPVPKAHEQAEIVDYLAAKTAKLDSLRTESEGAIALLKERRSALIAAAVTGQIDVRGWTPNN